MNNLVFGSAEEVFKISSGIANKEAPHLTVPFYMPLAQSISLKDAMKCCSPKICRAVEKGTLRLLALAHGQMSDGPEVTAYDLTRVVP